MATKEQVIQYFLTLRDDLDFEMDEIIYDDLSKSLTFKQLQEIDHLRTRINKLYDIIDFLEKEGN